jgi:hypothetical protein
MHKHMTHSRTTEVRAKPIRTSVSQKNYLKLVFIARSCVVGGGKYCILVDETVIEAQCKERFVALLLSLKIY